MRDAKALRKGGLIFGNSRINHSSLLRYNLRNQLFKLFIECPIIVYLGLYIVVMNPGFNFLGFFSKPEN